MKANLARGYARSLDFFGLAAGLTVGVMAVMISLDVVIRNLGIGNFPWLLEVAEYALYLTTFLAAPWALRLGAHVRVDLVVEALPAAIARRLEILVDLIGAGICLVLLWYGAAASADSFAMNARFDKELIVSEWWLLAAIPLSAAMLVVEFLMRARRALAGDMAPARGALDDGI